MAGLAHIVLDCGASVSGSDAVDSEYIRSLARHGAAVQVGHGQTVPEGTELLVYSSAVQPENPERQRASELGIPSMRRGEFLAAISGCFGKVVAVSGSHGKTTTTAMLAQIFRSAGIQAGYMVGGMIEGWDRNGAAGDFSILVTEVDESDGTQALMHPDTAIVLNVEDDHSWSLGGQAELERCFRTLAEQSRQVLAWRTDSTDRILAGLPAVRLLDDTAIPAGLKLPVPGAHNRRNAAIAMAAAQEYGISPDRSLAALQAFPGVSRRLSLRWQSADGARLLYEDYAHHPTELQACLQALRELHPAHRLVAVFQPHRQERVRRYGRKFAELLAAGADFTYVLPTFAAWLGDGDSESGPGTIVREMEKIRPGSGVVREFRIPEMAEQLVRELEGPGAVQVVIIGAGDIVKLSQETVRWKKSEP